MEKLSTYEQLRSEISEDLDSLKRLDIEPELKQLTSVAEKYLSAVTEYWQVRYSYLEEGRFLESDLRAFYYLLYEAGHPAAEMFFRAIVNFEPFD